MITAVIQSCPTNRTRAQQNGPLKMPLTSHDLVELSLFISHIRAHAQETRAYAEWHAARIWMSPEIDPQVYREILDFSV